MTRLKAVRLVYLFLYCSNLLFILFALIKSAIHAIFFREFPLFFEESTSVVAQLSNNNTIRF